MIATEQLHVMSPWRYESVHVMVKIEPQRTRRSAVVPLKKALFCAYRQQSPVYRDMDI